jgi:glutamate dehydrogenase
MEKRSLDPVSAQARAEVKKIVDYSKAHLVGDKQAEAKIRFIQLYYSQVWAADLGDRPIDSLFGAAMAHWNLAKERRPKELKIQVFNPTLEEQGWASRYTIIQMITDDMPFLIDSMRMELNRMGFTIHLVVSMGGMSFVRDKDNQLLDVVRYEGPDNQGTHEAPIMMQIDKQLDPAIFQKIIDNLRLVLSDARSAVEDWSLMQERMREMVLSLKSDKLKQNPADIAESIAFLEWLLANHFTFLGCRDYVLDDKGGGLTLHLVKSSGLGVLRDETRSKMDRNIMELPEKVRRLVLSKDDFLIISKTNTRATVHRPTYTDYIGIKRFDENGELVGERRFIGLYTSLAYDTNPKHIPFLRNKVATVMKRSAFSPRSHGGKDLLHILSTLPRDDLFQSTNDELFDIAMGILHLQDRRRTRLFLREDAYGRFISCLIYIPRENFNTQLIERMQNILMSEFDGVLASFTTQFSDSILARLHFIIRVDPKKERHYNHKELQDKIIAAGKTWQDAFKEATLSHYGEERGMRIFCTYKEAFSAGYQEAFEPITSIPDIEHLEKLNVNHDLEMAFYRPEGSDNSQIKFKLYCLGQTFPLSDALPMLENMGLRVMEEVPYRVSRDHTVIWINEFSMSYSMSAAFEVEQVRSIFQEAFYKVWRNEVENDAMNKLVLAAQLSAREISLLRAYAKYLQQTNFTFSYAYMAETLVNNPKISSLLVKIFMLYFNPDIGVNERENINQMEREFFECLESVASLDQDRILRRFMDLVRATLRTNYFQADGASKHKSYISLKFDPSRLPELPLPLPKFEIFVYAPHFEAVHLRSGKVARGGIRWKISARKS